MDLSNLTEEDRAVIFGVLKDVFRANISSPEMPENTHDNLVAAERPQPRDAKPHRKSSEVERPTVIAYELLGLELLAGLVSGTSIVSELTEADLDDIIAVHNPRPIIAQQLREFLYNIFADTSEESQRDKAEQGLIGLAGVLIILSIDFCATRGEVEWVEKLDKWLVELYKEPLWDLIHFTTPTAFLPLVPTFGSSEVPEGEEHDAGRVSVKRWIFLPKGVADSKRNVEIDLPFLDQDAGVEPLERQLRRICDPLGLKVLLGVLYFCHNNHRSNWFVYDSNSMCDLLGYARDSKGYHQHANKQRIEDRMRAFLKAQYRCEWTGGHRGRIPLEASLLLLDPKSSVSWIVDDVPIRRGQVIYFCGPLYDDIIRNGLYSWLDSRFLKLDAKEHGRVIQLGTYYSTAWRIDWRKSEGKLHRRLRTILSDIGMPPGIEHRHLHRTIEAIKSNHDFMAKEGFIRDWSIVEHADNPLDEVWEITIPDAHGLIMARKEVHLSS